MDPSGAGTYSQVRHIINQSNTKGLPLRATFRDISQEFLRMPVAEDTDTTTGAPAIRG